MAAKAGEAGDVTLPTRERTSNPARKKGSDRDQMLMNVVVHDPSQSPKEEECRECVSLPISQKWAGIITPFHVGLRGAAALPRTGCWGKGGLEIHLGS